METIISPVDRVLIEKELTEELFVRDTNNGHNKIFIFTNDQAPNLEEKWQIIRQLY